MDWNSKSAACYIEYVILNLEKRNNQFYWGESIFLEKEYIGRSYPFIVIRRSFNIHLDRMFGIPNLYPSTHWRDQDNLIRVKVYEQGANF